MPLLQHKTVKSGFPGAGNSRSSYSSFQAHPSSSPVIGLVSNKQSKSGNMSFTLLNDENNDNINETSRIPLAKDPSGMYSILVTDSDMSLTKRKYVKVSSVGEVEVSPDRIEFCVQITSNRSDKLAAKESIRKREDFIMLALKKLGIPSSEVTSTLIVKKYKLEDEEDVDDDILEAKILRDAEKQFTLRKERKGDKDPLMQERIKVMKEMYVVCGSVNTYMELFSIINEKLDKQVNMSPPVIRITPQRIQEKTQAAAKLAMDNAVMKATQVLLSNKCFQASVGKLFYSIEDSFTVTDVAEYHNVHTNTNFQTLGWKRNNKLIVCKLTSLFEVNTSRSRRVII